MLNDAEWEFVVTLGPKGFQTPMWDFNVMLVGLTRTTPTAGHVLVGMDAAEEPTPVTRRMPFAQNVSPQSAKVPNVTILTTGSD